VAELEISINGDGTLLLGNVLKINKRTYFVE
jgi:hypothetical protein